MTRGPGVENVARYQEVNLEGIPKALAIPVEDCPEWNEKVQLHVALNGPNPVHTPFSRLLEGVQVADEQHLVPPLAIAVVPERIESCPDRAVAEISAIVRSREENEVVKWSQPKVLAQVNLRDVFH